MSSLKRRIENIEDKLYLRRNPNPRVMIVNNCPESGLQKSLPDNAEEWLTYKQRVRDYPNTVFVLLWTSQELYARGLKNMRLLPE